VNVADSLLRSADVRPDQVAVRLDGSSLTYRELDQASARVAALLRDQDARPGDRLGVMLPNVIQFAVVYYGVLRAGCVVIPMNPLLKAREVAYYLADSGARSLFAWHAVADEATAGADEAGASCLPVAAEPATVLDAGPETDFLVARSDDDTAVILYTSGTTGRPKGAELTHSNLVRNADSVRGPELFGLGEDDVVFGGLPLFHAFGQTCALNGAVTAGATLTLLPRFDAGKVLEIIERDKVTVFEGVPTMYSALLSHPERSRYDVTSLRMCVSGGAAMPVEVLRAFEDAFGCVVLEGYGLSETSPVASFNHPHGDRKAGSIGTPIAGVRMRLADDDGNDVPPGGVGEILISGHNVMKGYWSRPEATEAAIRDGWFRTGDMGRVDADGYYYVVDRKKDLIIRGGFNVYPREVEEVLYEHPAVAEAAVIGVPHPSLGEEVGAAVTLRPGSQATPEELRDYVRGQIAAYKYPRLVWFVDALPKGPTGKILKRDITPPSPGGAQREDARSTAEPNT
jgi:long-chain acyl-CoA synthetase